MTRGMLWCGIVAGPLFVLVFLVNGAVTAEYDPLRHPVSGLALAPHSWVQITNFLVTGALYTAFGVGLWRSARSRAGSVLVALLGLGLVVSGLFVTDPVSGYPPGSATRLDGYSTTGAVHDFAALPIFLGLPVVMLIFAVGAARRRRWVWCAYSVLSAVAFFGFFACASAGFSQTEGFVGYGGLFQRISIAVGFGWLTALAWDTLRSRQATRA